MTANNKLVLKKIESPSKMKHHGKQTVRGKIATKKYQFSIKQSPIIKFMILRNLSFQQDLQQSFNLPFFQLRQPFGKRISENSDIKRVEWWIVLVAVVGALIFLAIFCAVLYRVSFFLLSLVVQNRGKRGDFILPNFEQNALFVSISWRNLTYFSLQPPHF